MKKLLALTTLFILFGANSGLAAPGDLLGIWNVDANCMLFDGNRDTETAGVLESQQYSFVITWQGQNFFKGYSCAASLPNDGIFFGVIDGKKIHASDRATTMSGSLNGQGDTMEFVTQNQPGSTELTPGVCMGTARKISDNSACL